MKILNLKLFSSEKCIDSNKNRGWDLQQILQVEE